MACGVHLGIMLVCLVQAEHVCCLWATQGQSSQRRNGNRYVGFLHQGSGLKRLYGSHPQNQFRQASVSTGSVQSSSLNTETVLNMGYGHGLPSSGYTQSLSLQKSPSADVKTSVYYGQKRVPLSTKCSGLFSGEALVEHQNSGWMQTSATAPGRRVSLRHRAVAAKLSSLPSAQNPSQLQAGKLYHHEPLGESVESSTELQYKQNGVITLHPYKVNIPPSKRLSYTASEKSPSSMISNQDSWNRTPIQGDCNLPASGHGTAQHFAPTKTYGIPQRFGGYIIRRLKNPADQSEVSVQKPQQTFVFPAWLTASDKTQGSSKWVRIKLRQSLEDTTEDTLPPKRIQRKKTMPGEMAQHEPFSNVESAYRIEVHNLIMDTVIESLHQQFLSNGTLYADLALLDPKNFDQITANTSDHPQTALQELSKYLLKFDSTATVTNLKSELSSLAEQWPRLKRSTFDEYTIRTTEDVPEEDDGVEIVNKS
ncbi:uncharacterized protein LOC113126253 [Mastacembelus armatus]|uniref:uncharacterized protein LOC113126253 n=1 Tax=Mastacembelus armatus TaxID=205130 RepID=UPI000E460290|nr:uncharacterized protein LOC113126253 [Mastacembelus armatus]